MNGSGFDYDVIVIGSGFGGSVATLRATEKGYRVGVMESGRRWPDSAIPKSTGISRNICGSRNSKCTVCSG